MNSSARGQIVGPGLGPDTKESHAQLSKSNTSIMSNPNAPRGHDSNNRGSGTSASFAAGAAAVSRASLSYADVRSAAVDFPGPPGSINNSNNDSGDLSRSFTSGRGVGMNGPGRVVNGHDPGGGRGRGRGPGRGMMTSASAKNALLSSSFNSGRGGRGQGQTQGQGSSRPGRGGIMARQNRQRSAACMSAVLPGTNSNGISIGGGIPSNIGGSGQFRLSDPDFIADQEDFNISDNSLNGISNMVIKRMGSNRSLERTGQSFRRPRSNSFNNTINNDQNNGHRNLHGNNIAISINSAGEGRCRRSTIPSQHQNQRLHQSMRIIPSAQFMNRNGIPGHNNNSSSNSNFDNLPSNHFLNNSYPKINPTQNHNNHSHGYNNASPNTRVATSNTAEIIARRRRQQQQRQRQLQSLGVSVRTPRQQQQQQLQHQLRQSLQAQQSQQLRLSMGNVNYGHGSNELEMGLVNIPLGMRLSHHLNGSGSNGGGNLHNSSNSNDLENMEHDHHNHNVDATPLHPHPLEERDHDMFRSSFSKRDSNTNLSEYSTIPSHSDHPSNIHLQHHIVDVGTDVVNNSHEYSMKKATKRGSSGSISGKMIQLFSVQLNKKKPDGTLTWEQSRNRILIGMVVVLLLAGGAICGILLMGGGDGDNGNGKQPSPAEVPANDSNVNIDSDGKSNSSTQSPQTLPSNTILQIVEPPPSDIEGRCSPSNLPGSASVCLAACIPSACCYPKPDSNSGDESTISGECYDEKNAESVDACAKYKPHCDVFYDPWPKATEGVLRSPPSLEIMEEVCGLVDVGGSEEVGDGDGFGSSSNSLGRFDGIGLNAGLDPASVEDEYIVPAQARLNSTQETYPPSDYAESTGEGNFSASGLQRKRSRTHGIKRGLDAAPFPPQGSLSECKDICAMAKCCFAPVILYPYASGLVLTSTGVYTSLSTGEYVMTSCAESEKNQELCETYMKYCPNEMEGNEIAPAEPLGSPWTSRPTLSPATVQPTALQASTWVIQGPSPGTTWPTTSQPVSASFQSNELASSTNAPTASSMLPSTSIYPTTSQPVQQIVNPSEPTSQPQEYDRIPVWAPLPSPKNKTKTESPTPAPLLQIDNFTAFNNANETSSSVVQDWNSTMNDTVIVNNITDDAISPTDIIPESVPVGSNGPPVPQENLIEVCSSDAISALSGINKCIEMCTLGACCGSIDEEENCFLENKAVCGLYMACEEAAHAYNELTQSSILSMNLPPSAPANLDSLCSYDTMTMNKLSGTVSGCSRLCKPGACCLEDNCLEDVDLQTVSKATLWRLEQRCAMYEPCNNLKELPTPPSNIGDVCGGTSPKSDECLSICTPVACCFPPSIASSNTEAAQSCYSYFEDTCKAYEPYCNLEYVSPATNPVSIPSPPVDLGSLCALGSDVFCNESCEVAKCCFESNPSESCLDGNAETCATYFPCAKLYT